MDVRSESLYALVSTAVSAADGIAYKTVPANTAASAFLGTMADFMFKMLNRITYPSCTLVSGGSAGTVAVAFPTVTSNDGGLAGLYHGVPFRLSAAGTVSGDLGSQAATTSTTIRKVLVGLSMGDISAVASSIASTMVTLTFVIGPAFTVSVANAASAGGVSAWFNQVATPKASAGLVPVGILNIPCSTTSLISNAMMTFPLRELYGVNLSLVMAGI